MLTVLIRYTTTGREVLVPARSVEYIPKCCGDKDEGLLINHGDSEGMHLGKTPEGDNNWRDVFVMNASGATVARYKL